MTLVNISNKIINLGTDPILPSETRPISKAIAELPAIKMFVEQQLVQIVDEGKTASSSKKNADKVVAPVATPAEPNADAAANGGDNSDPANGVSAENGKKSSQPKKK